MKIEDFEAKLSAKELQEFKENLDLGFDDMTYEQYLDVCETFIEAINGHIKHHLSPQGHDYWLEISQR